MRKLIQKVKGLTLIEWMIIVVIIGVPFGILVAVVTDGYSGHPATHRDIGVVQDVRHNVSEVVEVCHEGHLYIVRHDRLVSLDERC